MRAKYASRCTLCRGRIAEGDEIQGGRDDGWEHSRCPPSFEEQQESKVEEAYAAGKLEGQREGWLKGMDDGRRSVKREADVVNSTRYRRRCSETGPSTASASRSRWPTRREP